MLKPKIVMNMAGMASSAGFGHQNSLFFQAIEAVLGGWTALQLAVQHGFGGQHSAEKAQWMVTVIEQWFLENSGIESYELEDFITEIMNTEFDTVTDDCSIPEISKSICGYYRLFRAGQEAELRSQLSQLPSANLSGCQAEEVPEEDMDDTPDPSEVANHMENLQLNQSNTGQEPPPGGEDARDDEEKEPENDGWTCVKRKGKNR